MIDLLPFRAQVCLFEFSFKFNVLLHTVNALCNLQFTNHTFQSYVSQWISSTAQHLYTSRTVCVIYTLFIKSEQSYLLKSVLRENKQYLT